MSSTAVSIPSAVSICKQFLYEETSSHSERSPGTISQDLRTLMATVQTLTSESSPEGPWMKIKDQLEAILDPKRVIRDALEHFKSIPPSLDAVQPESPRKLGLDVTEGRPLMKPLPSPISTVEQYFMKENVITEKPDVDRSHTNPDPETWNAIKSYLDQSFSSLQGELKDLKKCITEKASTESQGTHSISPSRRPTVSANPSMIRRPSNAQLYSLLKTMDVTCKATVDAPLTKDSPRTTHPLPFLLYHCIKQLKKSKQDVTELRLSLAVSKQVFSSQQSDIQTAIQELLDMTTHVKNQLLLNQDGGRKMLSSAKKRMKEQGELVSETLKRLQEEIEEIKTDCVVRKCRLDPDRMMELEQETRALHQSIMDYSEFVYKVKPSWKTVWEKELQSIVQEQAFLKEQEQRSIQVEEEYDAMIGVFATLQQLLSLQKKSTHLVAPVYIQVAPVEQIQEEGLGSVLNELQLVVGSHRTMHSETPDSIMTAIEKTEARRLKRIQEAKETGNELTQQVRHFVDQGRLKKTGGVEEIERRRQKQDQENIRASITNRSSIVSGPAPPTV